MRLQPLRTDRARHPAGLGRRLAALLILIALLALTACERTEPAIPTPTASSAGEPDVVHIAPAENAVSAVDNNDAVGAAEDDAYVTEEAEDATPTAQDSGGGTAGTAVVATATPAAGSDLTQGRVVLWHSYAGADADALAAILTDLQRIYPDLTVETLFVAYDDLPQSYADAVLVGGGPDLVAMPAWWLTDMVAAGIVQPLDALIDPESVASYFPAAVETLRRSDTLYGLPLAYELVGLFVNRALLGDAELPATTDALLALAQSDPATGAGIYANLYHLVWGLPAFGATLLDDEGVVVLDQGEGAADFLTWLAALNDTDGSYVDRDYGMLLDRFKKGEFAFFVDGPWASDDLRNALGESLDVIPLPAGPTGAAQPWLSADAVLLNPNKEGAQQQRALLVAQALTAADAGRRWAEMGGRLSAAREAAPSDNAILAGFAAQAASAQPFPHQSELDEVWGYGGDMILKTLNGVQTPAQAVREAAALINEANGK